MIKKVTDGYKVPDGYFDSLHNRVQDRLQSEPKIAGMKVPEGYFETIAERVVERESITKLKVVHKKSTRLQFAMAVASMAVLAFTIIALWPQFQQSSQTVLVADLDLDSVLADESLIEELSIQQLAQLVDEEDIDNIEIEFLSGDDVSIDMLEEEELQELNELF